MGNEVSLVQDCKLEKEVPLTTARPWTLYQARRREGARLSVFVYPREEKNIAYIDNAAKYLKVLRHPSVLKFDALDKTTDGVWLATESVTPLELALEELTATEIVAGIHNILEGIVFLHERGGLCHNNLSMSSLFVSPDGTWKLGSMEILCRFDQATSSYLEKCKTLRDPSTLSPEEKAGKVENTALYGQARDTFGFGVIAEHLLQYLDSLGDLTKTFALRIQDECLNGDPRLRPKLSSLLEDRLFKNEFCQILNFLKNITLKSEEEKKHFFFDMAQKLHDLPVDLVASRLARPLLSRFILLDQTACECVIPHILTPKKGPERKTRSDDGNTRPLLPERLFRKHVVPEIFKILHVRDAHIRMVLLRHFDLYVTMFDKETLTKSVLPQLLLGIRDTNDELVAMSLRALASLVPVLGGDVVVGANRGRVFTEGQPKFGKRGEQQVPEKSTSGRITQNGSLPSKDNSCHSDGRTLKEVAREAERQRRREEADRRREEARRRSEQRRMRREQRKLNPQKSTVVSEDSEGEDDETKDTTETFHAENQELNTAEEDEEEKSDWSDWEDRGGEREGPGVKSGTEEREDKEKDGEESGLEQTETDIERDIEEELCSMDSPHPNGRLKLHSPDPDLAGVKVDWNNAPLPAKKPNSPKRLPTVTSSSGKLLLKTKKTNQPDAVTSPAEVDLKPDTRSGSRASLPLSPGRGLQKGKARKNSLNSDHSPSAVNEDASPLSPSIQGKTGLTSKVRTTKNSKWKDGPPGADYDIKSLDTTSTSGDADFFADMAPKIKTDPHSLWGMLKGDGGGKGAEQNSQKSPPPVSRSDQDVSKTTSMSFAVAAPDGVTEDGWGDDDLDWTVEDDS